MCRYSGDTSKIITKGGHDGDISQFQKTWEGAKRGGEGRRLTGSDSGSRLEAGAEAGAEVAQKTEVMSAEERNIVQLFKGGSSRRDICKQVFGVTGGRKYDEATSKIEVAIRKAMQ